MKKSKLLQVQYRYYETPPDSHVLALLGTGHTVLEVIRAFELTSGKR